MAADSVFPSAAACVAQRTARSAAIGNSLSPRSPSSSSRAFSLGRFSRSTLAYTRRLSPSAMDPFASSLEHNPAASASAVGLASACMSMAQMAHMTCLGLFVSLYSFIAHCCCLTKS